MKKSFLILILSNICLFSSFEKKLEIDYENKVKKIEKVDFENKFYGFNKINISSTTGYGRNFENSTNSFLQDINLKWGFVSYNISYDFLNKNILNHNIGISQNINEFLYDKIKESKINMEISKNTLIQEKNSKYVSAISILKKYFLKKKLISLNEKENDKLNIDLNILEKNIKLGNISEIEYKNLKNIINLSKLKFEQDKLDLELIEREIVLEEINKDNFNFFNVKLDKKDDSVLKKYINITYEKNEKLEIEKLNITKQKDIFLNKMPYITPSINYDIKNKTFNASINISKELNVVDFMYEDSLLQINEDIQNKQKEIAKNIEKQFINLKRNYETLYFQYDYKKMNIENLEREIILISKKYDLGLEKLTTLIEKRNELIKMELELEELKYEINIFEWKLERGFNI